MVIFNSYVKLPEGRGGTPPRVRISERERERAIERASEREREIVKVKI